MRLAMPSAARFRAPVDAEERHHQLIELSPDAILVHDGERIVFGNAAALRLTGATHRDQLVGQLVDRFLAPPFLKSVAAWLTCPSSLDDPAELSPAIRDTFRRLNGSSVEVEVRSVAFLDAGRASAYLVIRDITDRLAGEQAVRSMEERQQHAHRLEAIGTLAGGVAHEVNNMMEVVLGFGRSLLRDTGLPAGCVADIQEIVKAADRAAAVTRQLLAFGRRASHQPRVTGLATVVRDSEPMLRQVLGPYRGLVLDADADPVVQIDAPQFREVLVNLTINARDAMPEGGTLTLITGERTLSGGLTAADGRAIPQGWYATLAVRDTGAGMHATDLKRIFEPFFTTKPTGHGTGLGLAAVHGVLVQHAGFITVASAPGQGATFTLYLPALPPGTPPEQPETLAAAEPVASASKATVLVVDDEPAVLMITARTLTRSGHRVLEARDGGEALALVNQLGPPDLVLTDLTMPGMGGVELGRQLRERWPALPILFMSGFPTEELRRQGGSAAAVDLIEKPFSVVELTRRVSAALRRGVAVEV
jgi:two-component system, cell cycle sensor histidine kinase and response regulator CckA